MSARLPAGVQVDGMGHVLIHTARAAGLVRAGMVDRWDRRWTWVTVHGERSRTSYTTRRQAVEALLRHPHAPLAYPPIECQSWMQW